MPLPEVDDGDRGRSRFPVRAQLRIFGKTLLGVDGMGNEQLGERWLKARESPRALAKAPEMQQSVHLPKFSGRHPNTQRPESLRKRPKVSTKACFYHLCAQSYDDITSWSRRDCFLLWSPLRSSAYV